MLPRQITEEFSAMPYIRIRKAGGVDTRCMPVWRLGYETYQESAALNTWWTDSDCPIRFRGCMTQLLNKRGHQFFGVKHGCLTRKINAASCNCVGNAHN